jgi:hypothetical protein
LLVDVGGGVRGEEVRKEAGSGVDGSGESKGSVTKYIRNYKVYNYRIYT